MLKSKMILISMDVKYILAMLCPLVPLTRVIPIKSSYGPVFFINNNCNLVIIDIIVKTAYWWFVN